MMHGDSPDLVVEIGAVDQLFNAPPINAFSERNVEVLGVAGLSYVARQLQNHRRDWQRLRLVIRLPADQITPGLDARLADAVRRYCHAKLEDNALEIRMIRIRSGVGLSIIAVIVVAIIAIAYFMFTGVLADTPQAARYLVAGAISVFSWVVLWDVLEALIFNPIPFQRENAALRKIAALAIVVESDRVRDALPDMKQ
ncbi:MAG: hypothetical protein ACM3N4_07470 [Nitrososphaerota archaeon]